MDMVKGKPKDIEPQKFVVVDGKKVKLPHPPAKDGWKLRVNKKHAFFAFIAIALLAIAIAYIGGNVMKGAVETGDTVKVDYVGTLDNGTVFDTSLSEEAKKAGVFMEEREYAPLEFTIGTGQVIPGFDKGVTGMKVGETKTVKIPADEAYGQPREDLVVKVPQERINGTDNRTVNIGEYIFTSNGQRGVITDVSGGNVTVDFNHPLAGKNLNFRITLVDVKKGA